MKLTTRVTIVMVTLCLAQAGKAQPFDYPPSRQVEVVDDYQDIKISDPYRWLEDLNSTETKAWINAQNAIAIKYLSRCPSVKFFANVSPSCGTTRKSVSPNVKAVGFGIGGIPVSNASQLSIPEET
jgi:hypothetical protein